jgi:predicted metal-dependent hydrolase
MPLYAPLFLAKQLVKNSRSELREMIRDQHADSVFTPGMQIGKSHTLIIQTSTRTTVAVTRHGQQIIAEIPEGVSFDHPSVQRKIRDVVIEALRIEAKSYLSKRLSYLANQHGYTYERVRFSHAGSRWGSCSTSGTISLNIALMKLPFELIDYVIIHELSHTRQMNHSDAFWQEVAIGDPQYKKHRMSLKKESPSI